MNNLKLAFSACALTLVAGCGTFSQEQVKKDADQMRTRIDIQRQEKAAQSAKPLVERMTGSYLGSTTVPLAYSASLPSIFRDKEVTLNFPVAGKVNLSTIASRITDVTKLPVRIRPDVFLSAQSLLKFKDDKNGTPGTTTAPSTGASMPLPSPLGNQGQGMGGQAVSTQMIADYDANLPMEYSGNLAGYLDFISARLGINWEYRDGGITLYRTITKTFVVKVSPGDLKYASTLSKGGSNSQQGSVVGAAGGPGSSGGAGSFSSDTSSSIDAQFSLWKSMASAIDGMKSAIGNYTIDQAAGLVIVTDTRDVVDSISRYVDEVNSTLTRQIDLEVRVMTVSSTDSVANGFNINLLYSKIDAMGQRESTWAAVSPGTLVGSDAGVIGFSVLSPTNRWGGSTIVAQALKELGTIISDTTKTATTTNRVPVPIANFTTEGYLASTTPGTSGIGGSGLPGLTPGQLTTGSFLNVLPTAFENGSVLLRLAFDDTVSNGMGVISSGTGPTFQQIQTPKYSGTKSDHSVGLKDGESLILMATSTDRTSSTNRNSITGISETGQRVRETQIIVVTPRVRAGI